MYVIVILMKVKWLGEKNHFQEKLMQVYEENKYAT